MGALFSNNSKRSPSFRKPKQEESQLGVGVLIWLKDAKNPALLTENSNYSLKIRKIVQKISPEIVAEYRSTWSFTKSINLPEFYELTQVCCLKSQESESET